MKRSITMILATLMLALLPYTLKAEEDPDVRDLSTRERIFVGGSLGLQFGTITAINVSPIVGYRITNRLSAGLGGTYHYYNDRSFARSYTTSVYGGGAFARFLVISQAFIHVEYERASLESYRVITDTERTRIWEDNYFVGAGYRIRLGEKAYFNIMLLYNLNDDSRIYYQNPTFRFGVDVGL